MRTRGRYFFIMSIEDRKETNAKHKVRISRAKTGLGLFALEPIPKGKKIIEYVGNVLTNEPNDATDGLYIFNINKKVDICGKLRWSMPAISTTPADRAQKVIRSRTTPGSSQEKDHAQ